MAADNSGIGDMRDGSIGGNARVAGIYNDNSTTTNVIQQSDASKPIPSEMPDGSKHFVERDGENDVTLQKIHDKLKENQGVIVCAVEGMGGVGKTELALQYAAEYKDKYTAQYFLSLRESTLGREVIRLASPYIPLPEPLKSESVEQQAAWYWKNWLPDQGEMLVILDDVTDSGNIPELAMPRDPRVKVLITTRRQKLRLGFESLKLETLSEAKAVAMLKSILGAPRVEVEIKTVKAICKTLGYLPLGLELVGEYLWQNEHLSFADLQEQLSLADESLARERPGKCYAQRGVAAAMQLSWENLSTAAQQVAMWLGLFAPVEICWDLVVELGAFVELSSAEFKPARNELNRLHLIKPINPKGDFYTLHSLIHDFLRDKLAAAAQNQQYRQRFVTGLLDKAKSMPYTPDLKKIAEMTPIIPHLEWLSQEMLEDIENPEEDNNLFWAFLGTARFYGGQGLYSSAEKPYQACLATTKKILGDRHPDVATSLNNLAALYDSQGKYEAAEPLYIDALEMWKELLGDRHSDVASSMNNLAGLYYSQGKYEAAEPLYIDALEMRKELLGDRHPDVATSMNNLALLYDNQGKYEAAEPLYLDALEMGKELLGDDHPDVAYSLNNLAFLRYNQNRYDEAESLLLQALEIFDSALGSDHPNTISVKDSLKYLRANR